MPALRLTHCIQASRDNEKKSANRQVFVACQPICRMASKAERYFRMGNAALGDDNPARAIRFYNKSLELEPGVTSVLTNKAGALMDLSRYSEALEAIDEAIRITPEYAKLHGMRGDILHALGRHDEGEKSYHTAIRLDPTNDRIRANAVTSWFTGLKHKKHL